MAVKTVNRSGLVQLALGLFLLVLGIEGFTHLTGFQSEVSRFFGNLFSSSKVAYTITIIIAVLQFLAGIFILLEFFTNLGSITHIILFVVIIFWIIYIAYANVYLGLIARDFKVDFVIWLKEFSINLLVLAGLFQIQKN